MMSILITVHNLSSWLLNYISKTLKKVVFNSNVYNSSTPKLWDGYLGVHYRGVLK